MQRPRVDGVCNKDFHRKLAHLWPNQQRRTLVLRDNPFHRRALCPSRLCCTHSRNLGDPADVIIFAYFPFQGWGRRVPGDPLPPGPVLNGLHRAAAGPGGAAPPPGRKRRQEDPQPACQVGCYTSRRIRSSDFANISSLRAESALWRLTDNRN